MNIIMIYQYVTREDEIENVGKIVPNLHDNTEYVIHIRNLKY